MPGFFLHQSNRLERLAGALAEQIGRRGGDPLVPTTIVVQNRGMERWLSLTLAEELGVWANFRFPFPNALLWEAFGRILPGERPGELFEVLPLAFRALRLLPKVLGGEDFRPLEQYLEEGQDDLRRYQLASRLADLYDQYATYRPEWILDWAAGKGSGWPARLWREMISTTEQAGHRPELFRRSVHRVRSGAAPAKGLPDPLHVFGISVLPPLHLEFLATLSGLVEVHLYHLNPCREFWLDIRSDKVQAKQARGVGEAVPVEDLHFERGHALLASQGILGQEFLQLLQGVDPVEENLWVDPGEGSLLARLQQDILELADRPAGRKLSIPEADASVRIHSCHGPWREMEVLRDALLARFEADPELEPRQVLVMAPEIGAYAPYIEAVFGGEADPELRIPFSIADRGRKEELPLIRAFLRLLDLEGSRLRAAEVLDLLEEPAIAGSFGTGPGELETLRTWVAETRICWGIDEKFRANLGLPPQGNHTWRAGLDRMLLGYALPGDERRMFADILPYEGIEGGSARLLGTFCAFAEKLFTAVLEFRKPRSLADWQLFLQELAATFLESAEEDDQVALQSSLAELGRCQELSGHEAPVTHAVVRSVLDRVLESRTGEGFLQGGVTFCSLLPMRAIPFKVIALVGMNDGEFPRRSTGSGLDLMSECRRPGDPSRRKEDRYLFLEALLSARDMLHVSFTGQSVRDNSRFPPSVMVSELLDTLEQKYVSADGSKLHDKLLVHHRLQAFHPDYYRRESGLFSFNSENFHGARALVGPSVYRPFLPTLLPEPEEAWRTLDVGDLLAFYRNPTRFFLRRRLGIHLEIPGNLPTDREPFLLDGLERYALKQELVQQALEEEDPAEIFELARARGTLPPGPLARPVFEQNLAPALDMARRVRAFTDLRSAPAPLAVDLSLGPFRLTGRLEEVRAEGLVRFRCAKLRARDRMSLWIEHLILCCLQVDIPPESVLLAEGSQALHLPPVSSCHRHLTTLLESYWQGLRTALPFFPESSLVFARNLVRGREESQALAAARSTWEGSEWSRGERDEPEHDYVHGRGDPFDMAFREVAKELLLPLLSHMKGA